LRMVRLDQQPPVLAAPATLSASMTPSSDSFLPHT
jgi:hypothetical protein